MIDHLPVYISLTFGLTALVTWFLFIKAIRNSSSENTRKKTGLVAVVLLFWLLVQALLTLNNSYNSDTHAFPPRIMLFGILPALLTIGLVFILPKGRKFMDSLPLKNLTYLNAIRIPVEIVLFWLYLNKAVPELMTFEGRNWDILAGITAPFVAYFAFIKNKLSRRFVLAWNFFCLGLLVNIVVNALLSAPSPIQRFAYEQPNVAILNFPFSWLPTFVVPIVLFCHLVSIRQLLKKNLTISEQ
jgi:hypothetical protein